MRATSIRSSLLSCCRAICSTRVATGSTSAASNGFSMFALHIRCLEMLICPIRNSTTSCVPNSAWPCRRCVDTCSRFSREAPAQARRTRLRAQILNEAVRTKMSRNSPVPMMITQNDHTLGVANGDVGVVMPDKPNALVLPQDEGFCEIRRDFCRTLNFPLPQLFTSHRGLNTRMWP